MPGSKSDIMKYIMQLSQHGSLLLTQNVNDPVPHFLSLNFTRCYSFYVLQEPITVKEHENNALNSFSTLISCKQSGPLRRFLSRTSLCHSYHNGQRFIAAIRKVGNIYWIKLCINNALYFLLLGPLRSDKHPVSRGLVTKITTIQVKLHVDENKNVTRSATCLLNATSQKTHVQSTTVVRLCNNYTFSN